MFLVLEKEKAELKGLEAARAKMQKEIEVYQNRFHAAQAQLRERLQ